MNDEFIESIVNIIKKEQIEKYSSKNSILNILCFDYDNFENYEIPENPESCINYFLMSDLLLYRYNGSKSIIEKEDIKKVFYLSFC
tara:strand:- start:6 stop:263 length:258 start_codon:yes stop_codon:yes gene_type:complete